MSTRCASLIAVFTLLSVPVLIAQAPAAPPAPPAPPASPKPGPEHEKLAYFEGRWTREGEMKAGSMGPGGQVTGTSNCQWFEGKFYLVCRSEGRGPSGPMESLGIMGYSTERKQYTYYGIDNSGMGADPAYGELSGDTWKWEGESTMGGQKMKGFYTVKQRSPDSYSWTFEMAIGDGPMTVIGEGTETRVK